MRVELGRESTNEFQELLELVSLICEMPMCFITQVENDRHLLKAGLGLPSLAKPKEFSLCIQTYTERKPLFIPDARLDSRYQEAPVMFGQREIRFYYGLPIVSEERVVGVLGLVDVVPRGLSNRQTKMLKIIARQIGDQIEREILKNRVVQLVRNGRRVVDVEMETAALLAAKRALHDQFGNS